MARLLQDRNRRVWALVRASSQAEAETRVRATLASLVRDPEAVAGRVPGVEEVVELGMAGASESHQQIDRVGERQSDPPSLLRVIGCLRPRGQPLPERHPLTFAPCLRLQVRGRERSRFDPLQPQLNIQMLIATTVSPSVRKEYQPTSSSAPSSSMP